MATPEPVDARLGRLLSTHPVDSGRYWSSGGLALALALGGVLLAGLLIADPDFVFGRILGIAVLPPLAGFPIAAVQLTRALRSSRDETYLLYENGIARSASGQTRSWTWDEVTVLRTAPEGDSGGQPAQVPYVRMSKGLGWGFRCAVRFTDGAKVRIDGYTADGPAIARTLLTHRPDAVPRYHSAKLPWVILATLPIAGAVFATPVVLIYRYMNATAAADANEGLMIALALVMIVCILAVALCFGGTVALLRALLRDRRDGTDNWRNNGMGML